MSRLTEKELWHWARHALRVFPSLLAGAESVEERRRIAFVARENLSGLALHDPRLAAAVLAEIVGEAVEG